MDVPLISICITCYNASKTIARAIDSALSQDWQNYEIIIIDDASTDGSQEIIKKIIMQYSFIRFLKNSINTGCAKSRNILIKEAKGEFIVFFDDDDTSRNDRLRLQYNKIIFFEKEVKSNLVCCFSSGIKIYPNGYKNPFNAVGIKDKVPNGREMADYLLFSKKDPKIFYGSGSPTCSLMLRKVIFKNIGYFDESLDRQEDIDFAIRFGLMGGHFTGIPEPVLTQFASYDPIKKNAKIEYQSTIKIINKHKEYLLLNKSYFYILYWTEIRFRHFAKQDLKAMIILFKLILHSPIRAIRHFISSATKRYIHEKKMG